MSTDSQASQIAFDQHDQYDYQSARLKNSFASPLQTFSTTGHAHLVTGVSWSCNGQTLASASKDGSIHLWGSSDFKRIENAGYSKHDKQVDQILWSPKSDTLLASSSSDQGVLFWDKRNGGMQPSHTFIYKENTSDDSQKGQVSVASTIFDFSPCGQFIAIASVSSDYRSTHLQIYDIRSSKLLSKFNPFSMDVTVLKWLQTNFIAIADSSGTINFINANDVTNSSFSKVEVPKKLTIQAHNASVACMKSFKNMLVSGGSDSLLHIWDSENLFCIQSIYNNDNSVRSAAFTYDGQILASAYDKEISLNTIHGHKLGSIHASIWTLDWHPSKYLLAYAGESTQKSAGKFSGLVSIARF